jgi:hypothetical protein
MAKRRQKSGPSDETIERVRFIVSFRATHAPSKSQPAAVEQDPLSAEFYSQLISKWMDLVWPCCSTRARACSTGREAALPRDGAQDDTS